MEKNALHIWPRKSFMMIALPNPDASFTCTLFWEFAGPRSFATMKNDDDVHQFFNEEFPDAAALMPSLLEDYWHNPTGSLVTIRCAPWKASRLLICAPSVAGRQPTGRLQPA
jgi:kynurenine 3-monooxygenase